MFDVITLGKRDADLLPFLNANPAVQQGYVIIKQVDDPDFVITYQSHVGQPTVTDRMEVLRSLARWSQSSPVQMPYVHMRQPMSAVPSVISRPSGVVSGTDPAETGLSFLQTLLVFGSIAAVGYWWWSKPGKTERFTTETGPAIKTGQIVYYTPIGGVSKSVPRGTRGVVKNNWVQRGTLFVKFDNGALRNTMYEDLSGE